MVWSTKYLGKSRDYVVIKHPLSDVEGFLAGVKFRRGYGVVERNSRYYKDLKKLPNVKNGNEFPLHHLKKLPFITRNRDVETIYGKDVFVHFVEELRAFEEAQTAKKIEDEQQEHLENPNLCKHMTRNGTYCKFEASEFSPSGYCLRHLLQDPKIPELGIKVRQMIPKNEIKSYKEKVLKELKKLKSEGKF